MKSLGGSGVHWRKRPLLPGGVRKVPVKRSHKPSLERRLVIDNCLGTKMGREGWIKKQEEKTGVEYQEKQGP